MKSQTIDQEKSAEFQDVKLDYPEEATSSQQRRTTPLGEFRVNTYTTDDQQRPAIAALTNVGFVVTWDSYYGQDTNALGVYAKRYDGSGVAQGGEFRVNTYITNNQYYPAIAGLTGGGFVVTWQSYGQDGGTYFGVYVQRYDESGVAQGGEFRVSNNYVTGGQQRPAIASLTGGGFVVTWIGACQDGDGSSYGICGRRYNGSGVEQGAGFRVNTYITGSQYAPAIAGLTGGGFVVTWMSYGQDGDNYGIYAKRYDGSGVAQGSEFRVNTYTTSSQEVPAIAALTGGGFVVTWRDGYGDIQGQIYKEPVLMNQSLSVNQSETVVITNAMLSAEDYFVNTNLSFEISNVQNGQFEFVSSPGIAITRFTQSQIAAGQVRFVHNDSEIAPSFDVSVSNGPYFTSPTAAVITFRILNNAPVLNTAGTPVLTAIVEDTVAPAGDTVSAIIINGSITDPDGAAVEAMAITSVDSNGTWEYSTNGGSTWTAIAPVSSLSSLLLDSAHKIRLIPSLNFNGGATLTYRAWDKRSGIAADKVNTSSNGEMTAFSSAEETATITVTPVNDVPVLVNHTLTVNEGQTVVLTTNDFSATDVDDDASTLMFGVSNVTQGRFEFTTNPGVSIIQFTQQQIIDSQVRFVHDGGETAPSFLVSVSDGELSTEPTAAAVTFSANVNDAPVLVNHILTVNEGGTVVLTTNDFSATDVDDDASTLMFGVSNVTQGRFEFITNSGVAIMQFTQQQIMDSQVRFVHDDGETAPSFLVSVSDGELSTEPTAAAVTFSANVNDAPVLINHILTVNEGQTVVLTTNDFSATDVDEDASTLMFEASDVTQGRFEFITNSGVTITQFTQQQISDGQVRFVHDGGELAPSFNVTVSDGLLTTDPVAATIIFTNVNDAPTDIQLSTTTVDEEQPIGTAISALSTMDEDPVDTHSYAVVAGTGDADNDLFAIDGNMLKNAVILDYETQASLSIRIQSTDSLGASYQKSFIIVVTNLPDAPVLVNHQLTVSEGQTVLLTPDDFSATDVDSDESQLIFEVTDVSQGQFALVTNANAAIDQFTQQQVINGQVQFTHDGGEVAPSFNIVVSDGELSTEPEVATITFVPVNDSPVLINRQLAVSEGATIEVTPEDFSATDVDSDVNSLVFVMSDVAHGRFELTSNLGEAVDEFTQQQITSGLVQFMHDGGETAPTMQIQVRDEEMITDPAVALIGFTNVNDAPTVNTPMPDQEVKVGQSFTIDIPGDTFIDADDATEELILDARQLDGSPLPGWISFVQNAGVSLFEGKALQASELNILLEARDPSGLNASDVFKVTALDARDPSSTGIFGKYGDTASIVGPAIFTVFTALMGFRIKQLANQRAVRKDHLFADLLRKELKLAGVDNFENQKGRYYVKVIDDKLIKRLHKEVGINVLVLATNLQISLAREIAEVIRKVLNSTISRGFFGKYSNIEADAIDREMTKIIAEAKLHIDLTQYQTHSSQLPLAQSASTSLLTDDIQMSAAAAGTLDGAGASLDFSGQELADAVTEATTDNAAGTAVALYVV